MFKKIRKEVLEAALKAGMAGALGWVLYQQVVENAGIWTAFRQAMHTNYWIWLLVTIVLMPVNWGLEALKWRLFFPGPRALSFRRAIAAVVAGVALALITPHRIGDYGGRALLAPRSEKWPSVWATALSGYCQLTVVWVIGLAGAAVFGWRYWPELRPFLGPALPWVPVLTFGLTGGLLFARELFDRLSRFLPVAWANRVSEYIAPLSGIPKRRLGGGLVLALLRYSVYSGQYVMMLRFFGVMPSVPAAFSGVALIFLLQTSVPLPPLLGLLARGEIALLVWGNLGANPLSVLAATFGLFIINLLMPSLLGLVFIVHTRLLNTFGYEKTPD